MSHIRYSPIPLLCSALAVFSADLPQLDAQTIAANARYTKPTAHYELQREKSKNLWKKIETLSGLIADNRESLQHYCNTQNVSKNQLFDALCWTIDSSVHFDVIRKIENLLEVGADINGISIRKARRTPLMLACYAGRLKVIRLLLAHGAWVNVENSGHTAFLSAMRTHVNPVPILELLLKHGANPFVKKRTCITTPLREAIPHRSFIIIAQWLLDNNAVDVEEEDTFLPTGLLCYFNSSKHPDKVAWLLRNGAQANSSKGFSNPLYWSTLKPSWNSDQKKYNATLQILAERGARLSPQCEQKANATSLAMICKAHKQRCKAINAVLIRKYNIPDVLADLICQFSDDAPLKDSIIKQHNAMRASRHQKRHRLHY